MTDEWYREQAVELLEKEGTLEIDDNAKVSRGDDAGAYVQAWVWVPDPICAKCRERITSMNHCYPEQGRRLFPWTLLE